MVDVLNDKTTGILYLAGPYTHPDPEVREARYHIITSVAAEIVARGRIVFSPLTMTHPIDKLLSKNTETLGSDYWVRFDESFMEFCSEMAVLMLNGWDKSSGVAREIKYFRERGRPIYYLKYSQLSANQDHTSSHFEVCQ